MSYQFDHRQLADEMELFFLDEEIGAGLPVWLPNGVVIRDQLEAFIKELERLHGYERVVSPHLGRQDLYEKSGHLGCFSENMFPPIFRDDEKKSYYLKPMNCPHHHKVFKALPRSYRNLPLRIAEYGQVYRYEPSGSLRGLSRVRGLCQNDAHIYVEKEKIFEEILNVLDLHELCYKKLGLSGYRYRLSKRDPSRSAEFQGSEENWNFSEELLKKALDHRGLVYFEALGEAAFYGPKIDVQMRMGSQEESIASVQLDFNSAEGFDLSYVSSSGGAKRPWIIHRAPLGSHERFVALLLEYFDGQLPAWLSPVQVMLIPVSEEEVSECQRLHQEFQKLGIRSQIEVSQGSLSKRILFAHRLRPFSKVVIGKREVRENLYGIEMRGQKSHKDFSGIVEFIREECRQV